jgi:hypothetical protein
LKITHIGDGKPVPDAIQRAWDLFQWNGEVRLFAKNEKTFPIGSRIRSANGLAAAVRNLGAKGLNVYLNINVPVGGGLKAARKHMKVWRAVPIDLDPDTDAHQDYTPGVALGNVLALAENLLPGIRAGATIAYTGRGMQAWLFLAEPVPIESLDHAKTIERKMSGFLHRLRSEWAGQFGYHVDTSVSDLPRVVRCPGSINMKTGQTCRIIAEPTANLCSSMFDGFEADAPKIEIVPVVDSGVTPYMARPFLTGAAYGFITQGEERGGRHKAAVAAVRSIREIGLPLDKAMRWVSKGANRCVPVLPQRDVQRIVSYEYERELE